MQTVQSRVTSRAAVKVQAFFKKGTQGTAKPKKGSKKVASRAPEEQGVWLPGADRPGALSPLSSISQPMQGAVALGQPVGASWALPEGVQAPTSPFP